MDYRTIFENIGTGVIVFKLYSDSAVRVLDYNEEAGRVFGFQKREEVLNKSVALRDFIANEDYQAVIMKMQEMLDKGSIETTEFRVRVTDGCVRWVIARFSILEAMGTNGDYCVLILNIMDIDDRKKNEESFFETYRAKYNDFIDRTKTGLISGYANLSKNDFLVIHDKTGYLSNMFNKHQRYNDIVYLFINYHSDEAIRERIKKSLFPGRLIEWYNKGNNQFSMEYNTITPFGKNIRLNVTYYLIQNPDGDIEAMIMIKETTAEFIAAKVREFKQKSHFLNTFLVNNEEGTYAQIDSEAEDVKEIIKRVSTIDEQIEFVANNIIAPEDREEYVKLLTDGTLKAKLDEDGCFTKYMHYIDADGNKNLCRHRYYYLDDADQRVVGLVEDCSQEYKIRRKLEDTNRELRDSLMAFELLRDSFYRIGYINLNKNEITLLKTNNRENLPEDKRNDYEWLINYTAKNFVLKVDRQKFLKFMNADNLMEIFSDKKASVTLSYQRYVNEELKWVECEIVPLDDYSESNQIAIVYVKNITEQKAKEAEYNQAILQKSMELREAFEEISAANKNLNETNKALEMASAAKSEFLSHISHDIRTPLNGVRGMLEIAENNINDIDRVRDCLAKIRTSSDYLLSLINDVLDMSKLEAGKVTFTNESVDIREVLRNTVSILANQAAEKNITIDTNDFDNMEVPVIVSSPLHLRQIFLNIVSNAIKYNNVDGRISIGVNEVERTKERITYSFVIKDTGIGMSESFMSRIFEPFTQENEKDNARTKYKGTGLGMSIVKSLVDNMGGTIKVSSKKGIGSTFEVIIPFITDSNTIAEKKNQEEKNLDFTGVKVLVAEDNDLNMEIIKYVLETAGMEVTEAFDGKQAVDKFAESEPGHYEVILMDVMMPEMNGIEATKAIRGLGREDAKKIPIIAMTANAFAEDMEKTKNAGMNDHLAKPIDTKLLFKTLSNYF